MQILEVIKLFFTDRNYYNQRKRYVKRQKAVRKQLKKQVKEFCPWSGYYMHKMICTMLEFYFETYKAGDCCWTESGVNGKTASSIAPVVTLAQDLDLLDELSEEELIKLAEKDRVAFVNYVNKFKKEIKKDEISDRLLSSLAYEYLLEKYTKKMYKLIGERIWEWCD